MSKRLAVEPFGKPLDIDADRSKYRANILGRFFQAERLERAFVVEPDGRFSEASDAREIVRLRCEANAEVYPLDSEALELISYDERRVLYGRRGEILKIVEEKDRACIRRSNEMRPGFQERVLQQGAARIQEISVRLTVYREGPDADSREFPVLDFGAHPRRERIRRQQGVSKAITQPLGESYVVGNVLRYGERHRQHSERRIRTGGGEFQQEAAFPDSPIAEDCKRRHPSRQRAVLEGLGEGIEMLFAADELVWVYGKVRLWKHGRHPHGTNKTQGLVLLVLLVSAWVKPWCGWAARQAGMSTRRLPCRGGRSCLVGFAACGWESEGVSLRFWERGRGSRRRRGRQPRPACRSRA